MLVFARLLRERGVGDGIDLVVVHHAVSDRLVDAFAEAGLEARRVEPPRRRRALSWPARGARAYFRHSLTKLRVFELTRYDRVVFADADAVPLKSLDHLFGLTFPEPVAAPLAYWHPQPWWTSALMVIAPDETVGRRLVDRARAAGSRVHDMEVINWELEGKIHTLNPDTFCLSSEWGDPRAPRLFADPADAYSRVSIVHMTAIGKPWSHSVDEVRRLQPDVHPLFLELWSTWRDAQAQVERDLRAA